MEKHLLAACGEDSLQRDAEVDCKKRHHVVVGQTALSIAGGLMGTSLLLAAGGEYSEGPVLRPEAQALLTGLPWPPPVAATAVWMCAGISVCNRSEEHTSELQS